MPEGDAGGIFVAGPEACATCAALDGQQVSGKPHPNCRCCPVDSHSEYVVNSWHTERSGGQAVIVVEATITCCDGSTYDRTHTFDLGAIEDRLNAKYPMRPGTSDENWDKFFDELEVEISQGIDDAVSPDLEELCPQQCVS